jgi:hypothetical protein
MRRNRKVGEVGPVEVQPDIARQGATKAVGKLCAVARGTRETTAYETSTSRVPHSPPAGAGRRDRLPHRRDPRRHRAAHSDSDDRACPSLALVPIALSARKPGSEVQAPVAMVIMFGLATLTALNMSVVPVVYTRFGRPARAVASVP